MSNQISSDTGDQPTERRYAALLGFILLLLALIAAMLVITPRDYAWTLSIGHHRIHWFSNLMGQTLFEGQPPGGPDIATLFIAGSFILYLLAWLRPRWTRLLRLRPYLGFIVCSGFICAIYMVHGLKIAIGRARPYQVIRKGLAYSNFFQFGPHYVGHDMFRASFPSGHTADAFTLMTLAYILAVGPGFRSGVMRLAGLAWGLIALAYGLLMAVARSMSLSHWIGDGLLAILMSWPIQHALYFWVLRVPEQAAETDAPATPMPFMWEFRLCWWLWWIAVGLVATVIGGRAFGLEQPTPWLAFLIPPGLGLILLAGHRFCRFYQRVRTGLP